jgi:putative peptidoglycan lipid II flippase
MRKSAMKSIVRSFGIVAVLTLLSRFLGFARDAVIASMFGASQMLDAFFIAFRIPNLFRRLAAEGILSVSFVPVLAEYRELHSENEANELARKVITLTAIVVLLPVCAAMLFSNSFTSFLAFGFYEKSLVEDTAALSAIMMPYLFFVSISAMFMGYLNSKRIFFTPSLSPVILNLSILAGVLGLSRYLEKPVYGAAIGVLAGGILQCLIQIPSMMRNGFRMKFEIDVFHPGVRKIFRSAVPFILAISVYQINVVVNAVMASSLSGGSVSWLYYADRLTELTLGIFVISLSNVLLPEMSVLAARGNSREASRMYNGAVRASLFIALPAAGALIVAGYPIVSILFMRGSFTPEDAIMTSHALACSGAGLVPLAVIRMLVPVILAVKKEKAALLSAAVALCINAALGLILMRTTLEHSGLALSNSIAILVQAFIMILVVRRAGFSFDRGMFLWCIRVLAAVVIICTAIIAVISFADWHTGSTLNHGIFLAGIISGSVLLYLVICYILKVQEAMQLKNMILRIIKKKVL